MSLINRVLPEIKFSTSRASGPGGQNVNKVETKVALKWDVSNSRVISDNEKKWLLERLRSHLTADGVLVLSAQATRSQLLNREEVLRKLDTLLVKAFHQPKPRKATKATASSRKKRLQSKKLRGEKKKWRQRPDA